MFRFHSEIKIRPNYSLFSNWVIFDQLSANHKLFQKFEEFYSPLFFYLKFENRFFKKNKSMFFLFACVH